MRTKIKDAAIAALGTRVKSKFIAVTIKGQILGTSSAGDHLGMVAEEIGSLKVGGLKLPTIAGAGNDNIQLSAFAGLNFNEI